MTTPNPITELLEALDDNPLLEAALRQRILTQELLDLPEKVAQLVDTVADMARVFDQRLTAVEGRLDTMYGRLDRMQGQLNNLTGTDYERRVLRRAPQLARRHLQVQNGQTILAINRPDQEALLSSIILQTAAPLGFRLAGLKAQHVRRYEASGHGIYGQKCLFQRDHAKQSGLAGFGEDHRCGEFLSFESDHGSSDVHRRVASVGQFGLY
jgi:hypothetical protein